MVLCRTQINYMPDKSHVIIFIISTQGQIVKIYFISKDCLTRKKVAGRKFHQCSPHFAVWSAIASVLERAVCHLAACSDNNFNYYYL